LGYGYCPRLIPWLRAHCDEYSFVVVNGIWQFNSFAAWRVLRNVRVPYFVFTHGMLDPWFKEHYPLKHLKKWLYWPWAEYRVLRNASAVLFTCQEEKILARRSFWLYRCHEAVVSYGTAGWKGDSEAQREAFLGKFPELRGKRLILFLGRIHEKKGGDLLIEAFHRWLTERPDPELHLVMAGPSDNPFGRKLKRTAESLGIDDQVTWTGMLQGEEKWGAFQASEVFILPSHQENFGISVAEALSASVPVLISNKVNIWREIDTDQAGLVENDDAPGTLALFRRWFSLDADERQHRRELARRCFLEHFEITKAAESLMKVYTDFLSQKE
jgi:glycosyltransferase involved in cell wall biosynthesis